MPDFPGFTDLFRVARDEIVASNARLSVDVVDREGTDANALVAAMAAVGEEVTAQLVSVNASLFLDTASGADLDRLVQDRYGMLRKQAAPAFAQIQFTTLAATGSAFSIPSGTEVATADGRKFITVSAVTFPAASTGPIFVTARSVIAGLDQQVKAGTITSILGSIPGRPNDLAVNNALASFGAADKETDAALRARASNFFTNARRGTLSAIEQGALAVPQVRSAKAFEALEGAATPAGMVYLTVADQYTDGLALLTAPVPAYSAQSDAVREAVAASLSEYRAAGVYVEINVAQVVMQPIKLAIVFSSNVDTETVALAVRAAALSYVNQLQPGQAIDVNNLAAQVQAVSGVIATGQEVVVPAGNVVPTPLQVLRTTLNLVTIL